MKSSKAYVITEKFLHIDGCTAAYPDDCLRCRKKQQILQIHKRIQRIRKLQQKRKYPSRLQAEEGLNVRIEVPDRIGTSPADRTEYINHVANTVLADLGSNPYIDSEKSWWNGGLREQTTLGGGSYYLVGDFLLGYLKDIFCIYGKGYSQ